MNQAESEYNEEGYYSDGNVWVTSRRLIYGGVENSLRGMKSARVRIIRAGDSLLSFDITILLAVPLMVSYWFQLSSPEPNDPLFGGLASAINIFLLCILSVLLLALIAQPFIIARISNDPVYTVVVRYRFWRTTVAVSRDRAYIERIVEVIQYAIVRRNNPDSAIVPSAAVGHSFPIPAPIVWGNTLHTGETAYNLAEVRSIKIGGVVGLDWSSQIVVGGLLFQQVFTYVAKNFKGMDALTFIGGSLIVLVFLLLAFFYSGVSIIATFPRIKYTLQLTTTKGDVSTIYATTSRADAEQVQQAINGSRNPQPVLRPQ